MIHTMKLKFWKTQWHGSNLILHVEYYLTWPIMEPNILAELTISISRTKQNIGWPVRLNYENIGLLSLNLKNMHSYVCFYLYKTHEKFNTYTLIDHI